MRLALASRGVDLPSYDGRYRDTSDKAAIGGLIADERDPWRPIRVGAERPWDLVLIHQRPWHVGLVVGAGCMLHMPHDQTSCIEPYSTFRYGPRIEGFYRHEALA
ncbi:hypothetical protein GCM10011390_41580 [Aureimonas endophytica]|uniref:NlpC/P60 family protein n=1 Tax=Aureimonas endophytica TaxID=2027858 RepID=A0A916ZZG4_9HYPH|nr:hypothetical protein GCM10011390_41580 [Aureimonas endophytica]